MCSSKPQHHVCLLSFDADDGHASCLCAVGPVDGQSMTPYHGTLRPNGRVLIVPEAGDGRMQHLYDGTAGSGYCQSTSRDLNEFTAKSSRRVSCRLIRPSMTCRDEVGRSYYIAAEALDKHRGDVSSHGKISLLSGISSSMNSAVSESVTEELRYATFAAALLQISPRPATSAADLYPWIPSNAKRTGSSHLPEEQEGDKRLSWHRCTTPNDHPHLICQRLDAIGDGTKGEVEWLHESRFIDSRW
ncbi:uncharacterized protein RAG0_10938 [Rhynchosporium agropyri]|uniref:Uncharacterized protein n=1 Tax=Rhynchosporium agropyri TaxID=914238 RepID=A0A1E1L1Y6_9HELO|nr:uncharacterized protein RAG0_10938 [Rhynchosporium agropyri]